MKNTSFLMIVLFLFVTLTSCEKDEIEVLDKSKNSSNYYNSKNVNGEDLDAELKMIQLIKKLENPYTVEAMQNAQQTLIDSGKLINSVEIRTTHHYVRFLPLNDEEMDILEDRFEEEKNELFDFPLDYELSDDGVYYHDPNIPDSLPTWQYTVVPVNWNYPSLEYEVLAELFLFEEEEENIEVLELIEDQSLWLTNNWDDDDERPEGLVTDKRRRKWRPDGYVKALDHQIGRIVPVPGAKVVMRRWFKWAIDYTDNNGYYSSPKMFRKKVNYKIKWVTTRYRIRSWFWGTAWTNGPRQRGAWNVTFTHNLRLFYATVHRAAHDFFYVNPFGLKKPNAKLKIYAKDGCSRSGGVQHHIASLIGGPDIKIWWKDGNCQIKNTLSLYGTTIHEIGHSNQRAHGVNKFIFCSSLIRESWANTVEYAFCQWKYNVFNTNLNLNDTKYRFLDDHITTNFRTFDEYPFTRIANYRSGYEYSPLFIDLMDNDYNNSGLTVGPSYVYSTMNEYVSGYTLRQLELAVANKGWSANANDNMDHIRDYLRNNYGNPTENNIEPYFKAYYRPHF